MEELVLMAAFFAPVVSARLGVACRKVWFQLSQIFFVLAFWCFSSAVAAGVWMLEILGRNETMKLLSAGTGLAGFLCLGCLVAGIFYREARA
jgi:hypothetical protein